MVRMHMRKAFRAESSGQGRGSWQRFHDRAGFIGSVIQTHTCIPSVRYVCTHTCTYMHISTPTHTDIYIPTHRHTCSGAQDPGATALSQSTSYLSLHDHCGALQSGRAGCVDAQFLRPSGPPAPAAGPPQPGREQRTPNSSERLPNRKEVPQVRVQDSLGN